MSNLATIVNNILADSGIDDLNVVVTTGSYSNPAWITALSWSKITSTPTTLAGYGITDAVPSTRTLTINGTALDLSANRSWSVGTVTSIGTTAPITGGTITGTGTIGITQATTSSNGYLSSADWNTFNNKQNALTLTTTGSSGAATLVGATLNIPNYGSALSGYLPLVGGIMTGGITFSAATTYTPLRFTGGVADYTIAEQDGAGRVNWYWNKSGTGGSPTYQVAGEDAIRLKFSTQQAAGAESGIGVYYAPAGSAGGAITWQEIMGAFHNGFRVLPAATFSSTVNIAGNLTVDTNTLFVDATNNRVGIGTTSPSQKLAIAGKLDFAAFETDADIFGMYASTAGTTISSASTYVLAFRTGAAERMRITSAGRLLLGTTTDNGTDRLQVSGSGLFTGSITSTNTSGTFFNATNTAGGYAKLEVSANATSVATLSYTNGITFTGGNAAFSTSVTNGPNQVTISNPATSGAFTLAALNLQAYNGTSAVTGASLFQTASTFVYGQIGANQTNLYGTQSGGIRIAAANAPIVFANGNADADQSTARLTIASTGAATFSSSVTAGGAIYSRVANYPQIIFQETTTSTESLIFYDNVAATKTLNFRINSASNAMTLSGAGAATFSSSVTASQFNGKLWTGATYNFEGGYLGKSTNNGGALLELLGHTSASLSNGFGIRYDTDVSSNLLFQFAGSQTTYGALSYSTILQLTSAGAATFSSSVSINGGFDGTGGKLISNGGLVIYGGAISNAPTAESIVIDQQVGGVARLMASGASTWDKPLAINPYGGRVLIGTTTDNTVDRLQVSGNVSVKTGAFGGIILEATSGTESPNLTFLTTANRYNLDNDNGTFRIFREDTNGTNGAVRFSMNDAGAATFSSSVTATSLIKAGGTSAQILAADGSVITAGTNITISGGTISAADVGFANPMTTLGDIIYGAAAGAATRLAGNTTATKQFLSQTGTGSASAAPSWSSVTKTDVGLSNVENTALSTWAGSANITTLGTIGTGTWNATTIGVTKGGTGLSALGTANQLLRVNAGATALEYFTPTYLTAAITSLNGLTAATQTFATGTAGTDFAISSTTSTHTFNIPSASTANRGLVTTGVQTFGGAKTFDSFTTFNANLQGTGMYINATSTGVGTNTLGQISVLGAANTYVRNFTYLNSTTLNIDYNYAAFTIGTSSITEAPSGTTALVSQLVLKPISLTNSTGSTTNAATLYIEGAAGGTATIANNYALWIDDGSVRIDTLGGTGSRMVVADGFGVLSTQTIPGASTTAGSVFFSNGTGIAQDNANFFWDDANNTFYVGANPSFLITSTNVFLKSKTTGKTGLFIYADDGTGSKFKVWDNGDVEANSYIKSGGTASQILAANGSVITAGTNITISGGTISATGSGGITGSGTTNYIPKWTSASTIGDSNLINDASGNLGLGVTPSAWSSIFKAIQVNTTASLSGSNSAMRLQNNAFVNTSGVDTYLTTDAATTYIQSAGSHIWYNAPSGTANQPITFTQAMTLNASGRLLLGTSTDDTINRLQVNGGLSATNLKLGAGTATVPPIEFTPTSAVLGGIGLAAGDMEVDANGQLYYAPTNGSRGVVSLEQFLISTSTRTLTATTTSQNLFATASAGAASFSAKANSTYFFEAYINITGLSASSNAVGFGLSTTAISSIDYTAFSMRSSTLTTPTASNIARITTNAITQVTIASATTAATIYIKGTIKTNTNISVITPIISMITNTAASIIATGTYVKFTLIGTNTVQSPPSGGWT